jgi:hypothetical protein
MEFLMRMLFTSVQCCCVIRELAEHISVKLPALIPRITRYCVPRSSDYEVRRRIQQMLMLKGKYTDQCGGRITALPIAD